MKQKLLQPKIIEFYRASGKYAFLSMLYKRKIEFEGMIFDTGEHAYQYGKYRDKIIADWVMTAPKPHLVAIISHGLFAWDIIENWSKIKVERMEKVVEAKFTQHQDLLMKLIQTNDAILQEASSFDNFWGIGKYRKGKNMLGKILMKTRSKLR